MGELKKRLYCGDCKAFLPARKGIERGCRLGYVLKPNLAYGCPVEPCPKPIFLKALLELEEERSR